MKKQKEQEKVTYSQFLENFRAYYDKGRIDEQLDGIETKCINNVKNVLNNGNFLHSEIHPEFQVYYQKLSDKAFSKSDLIELSAICTKLEQGQSAWVPTAETTEETKPQGQGGSTELEKDAAEQANGNKKQMGDTDKISNTINCCNWFNNNSILKVPASSGDKNSDDNQGGNGDGESKKIFSWLKTNWADTISALFIIGAIICWVFGITESVKWDAAQSIAILCCFFLSLVGKPLRSLLPKRNVSKNNSSEKIKSEQPNNTQRGKKWWIVWFIFSVLGIIAMSIFAYIAFFEVMFGRVSAVLIYFIINVACVVVLIISLVKLLATDKVKVMSDTELGESTNES